MNRLATIAAVLAISAAALAGTARAAAPPQIWTAGHPGVVQPVGRLITVTGTTTPALQGARLLSPLAAKQRLSLTISLRARNRAGLDALVRSQYTPGSTLFHHWLTPAEFAGRFAPPAAQRHQVQSWLRGEGLRVTAVTRNGLTIDASGSAASAERAFHTSLGVYRKGGERFFANAAPVRLPGDIASVVSGVGGLDDAERFPAQDRVRTLPAFLHRRDNQIAPVSPADLAAAYNLKSLYDKSLYGQNQTIGVVEESEVSNDDLAQFNSRFNLPDFSLERVTVNGAEKYNGNQSEAELDLEVIHSIAPDAHILMYEVNPTNSLSVWVDIWSKVVSDDRAPVISMSYGYPEFAWTSSQVDNMNVVLEEAASQGQATFASTGDHGAYDGHRDAFKDNPNYNKLVTHFPATSPWVTAVGGTQWALDNQGNLAESGWSEQGDQNNPPAGGGGGLSALNRMPWYQSGPGVNNQYSNGGREVPDVSALAGYPGYATYTVDDKGQNPDFVIEEGTSAATPLWAAYITLLNQSLNTRIGFLNPSLYLLGQKAANFQSSPFYDVTSGDNLYYPATPGYDLATGWGSMDGVAFHDDLASVGPVVTHPVNFGISFFTAKGRSKGKWKVIHALKRGQTAYIVDDTKYYDVPTEDSTGQLTLTVSNGTVSLVNYSGQVTVQHAELGHTVQYYLKFKVPSNAPKGAYSIHIALSVGAEGWNNAASGSINVK